MLLTVVTGEDMLALARASMKTAKPEKVYEGCMIERRLGEVRLRERIVNLSRVEMRARCPCFYTPIEA